MRSRLRDFIGTLRAKHILLAGGVLVCAAILLLVAMVALLPTLISTPQVQLRLKQYLTASLKQPVAWSKMTASWSDGVYLSDFALGDGPAPLLGASVGKLHLVPSFGKDSSGRLGVNLVLAVNNVQLRLAPGPKKPPPEKVPDPLTQIAEAVQKFQGLDWPLPVDVRATVEVMPMTVQYRDPASGRRLVMRDLAFRLAMPSLVTLPVETSLTGSVAVDDAEPERVRFSARITDLVTPQNRLRPASAQFSAKTELPGMTFNAGGGLNREGGLKASLRLALPELAALVAPLAPRALPSLSGQVALDLRADIDPAGDLKILLDLDGARISVGKIPGKKGYAGPLDIRVHQKIVSNHHKQQVAFTDGKLASPGLLSASWSATVDHPTERKRSVAARLGPVRLELPRAYAMAAPFLPKDFPLRELKGTAFVANIAAHWQGPKNNGAVTIEGAGVEMPQLRVRLAQGAFTGEGVTLLLDKGTVPLEALLPVQVSADLSWSGKRLELAGSKPVLAQGMKGALHLVLDDLDLKKKPALMRASAQASQTLDLESVKIGAEHALENVHEQLKLKARANGAGELTASEPELKVTVGALHTSHSGKKITLRPIAAGFSAESVHLPAKGKGSPIVQRARCFVSAADALRLTAEAGISGLAGQMATTKGSATFDLTRLFPMAAPFLPAGFAASGQAAASWDLAAPLPVKSPPKEKNPLRLAKGALALLDRGELTLKLDDLDLRLPTAQGKCIVKGVSTTPGIRFVIPRLAGPLNFEGGVQFAGISGLPGGAGKLPVQGGTFTMTGELSDWKELRLNEELRLTPLGLSQVGELTVSRIDALLEDQVNFSAATALKRLDATLFAHLDGNFQRQPVPVVPGLELDGNLSAGARIDLTAARELRVRGYAKSRDFGVRDGKGMAASGIKADLVVDRSYALAEKTGADWVPLSAALVRPAAHGTASAGGSDIAARIYEDLRGESSGPRKIRIRNASFKSGIVPLETTTLEADLLLEPEVIGLSFFQAEVGGGTVRARGVIDLSRELPVLSTSCNFSRLDPALLFPDAAAGRGAADGELTGEFTLSAPLLTEQRALLEGARLNLNLRRFSSRILEKALFAIDPYERNEKLVAQRKSLRMADLKELRVSAVDGALDLGGEVLVKGVAVEIPRVERLRLSELPIRKELASVVTAITKSRPLLDLVRSDTIAIGPKGELSLKRRTDAD